MNQRHDDLYVVLNIGSSYISGMLASKSTQGRVLPLAAHRLPTGGCVRHGCIHNIEETSRCISAIIDKLGEVLPEQTSIQSVYVGLETRSMHSVRYESRLELGAEGSIITDEHLRMLREQVNDASYPGMEVLSVAEPRYICDGKREATPRGVRCRHIEAHYLLIIARKNIIVNLRDTLEKRLGLTIRGLLSTPIAEATAVLTMEERVLGCAYVNIGGGTTSVAIYKERYPEALYVLPLGGNNVTRDLTQLPIPLLESDAERLKIERGSMDLSVSRTSEIYAAPASGGTAKRFSQLEVNRFISFRVLEILNNVVQVIQEAGYGEAIAKGFVFAGGVTKTDHFYETLRKLSPEYRAATLRREVYEDGTEARYLADFATEIALAYQAKESGVIFKEAPLDSLVEDPITPSATAVASTSEIAESEDSPEKLTPSYETENYTYPESFDPDEEDYEESTEEDEEEDDRPKLGEKAKNFAQLFGKGLSSFFGLNHDNGDY